jgi:hypothetical protein
MEVPGAKEMTETQGSPKNAPLFEFRPKSLGFSPYGLVRNFQ